MRRTEEEGEHKTLLFVAPAHLSTPDSSHATARAQLLRRGALLCTNDKTSETKKKKEMLKLGQFEKRLSRCTVPLPRPSKSSAAQWRRRGAETELEHNPAQGAEGVDETGSITARTRAKSGYFHEERKLLRAAEVAVFSLLPLPGSCQLLCPLRAPLVRDASGLARSGGRNMLLCILRQQDNLANFSHREEAVCKNTVGFRADPLLALKSGRSNQVLAQWGEPTPVWRCATMWDQFFGKNSPDLLFF